MEGQEAFMTHKVCCASGQPVRRDEACARILPLVVLQYCDFTLKTQTLADPVDDKTRTALAELLGGFSTKLADLNNQPSEEELDLLVGNLLHALGQKLAPDRTDIQQVFEGLAYFAGRLCNSKEASVTLSVYSRKYYRHNHGKPPEEWTDAPPGWQSVLGIE